MRGQNLNDHVTAVIELRFSHDRYGNSRADPAKGSYRMTITLEIIDSTREALPNKSPIIGRDLAFCVPTLENTIETA
jgi:hypothetical protein